MKKDCRRPDYLNSRAEEAINECIHNAKHRAVLKSRFIDGETFEELAIHYGMSDKQMQRIVEKLEDTIFAYIEKCP